MKKITLLAVAALAISFASCRKDHTCTCTETITSGSTTDTFVTTSKAKSTKKDGKAWCEDAPKTATETYNGTAVTGGTPATCVLS